MISSTANTKTEQLPKMSTVESENVETRANRLAADQMAKEVVAGFRKLAKQKAAQKTPHEAA
jgi:hypothetical protein